MPHPGPRRLGTSTIPAQREDGGPHASPLWAFACPLKVKVVPTSSPWLTREPHEMTYEAELPKAGKPLSSWKTGKKVVQLVSFHTLQASEK